VWSKKDRIVHGESLLQSDAKRSGPGDAVKHPKVDTYTFEVREPLTDRVHPDLEKDRVNHPFCRTAERF
jgi:hypothetical protein